MKLKNRLTSDAVSGRAVAFKNYLTVDQRCKKLISLNKTDKLTTKGAVMHLSTYQFNLHHM